MATFSTTTTNVYCGGGNYYSIHSSNLPNYNCCFNYSLFPSCGYNWGYSPMCGGNFESMAGFGVGYATANFVYNNFSSICKGIGTGCSWVWNNAIAPVCKTAGKAIGSVASFVGNGIAKGATAAWNGTKNFFSKLFGKD